MVFENFYFSKIFQKTIKLVSKNLCKHKILKFLKCSKNLCKHKILKFLKNVLKIIINTKIF